MHFTPLENARITLTAEQQAIIQADPGHYVITAVAGSGKTTTLAYRIQHLLTEGIDHRRILVLMFNKAAQRDFSAKLQGLIAANQPKPEVRTFHAMGYRLYKRFIQEGYLKPFHDNIISEKEEQFQLWRLLNIHLEKETVKDIKRNKKEHLELCSQFIETVKSGLTDPETVYENLGLEDKFSYCIQLFHHFEEWRQAQSRISYADMLYDPVRAIHKYPQLKDLVRNKMDIVLVDEYQDSNDIQHELLKVIAGDRAKVTVVGDPDQTIYEFRGAKPEYIIKGFSHEFDNAQSLHLSYSFRYGHQVALLANHLISHNAKRNSVLSKAHASNPNTMIHTHHGSEALIRELSRAPEDELNQSAILVRVWSQTVSLELSLLEKKIPYAIEGHAGIFHSDEMASVMTLLEIASGALSEAPQSERAAKFERLFKFPHLGIPESQTRQIAFYLSQYSHSWGKELMEYPTDDMKRFQSLKLERFAMALALTENTKRKVREILSRYAEQTELFEGVRSIALNHDQAEERIASIEGIFGFVSAISGSIAQVLDHLEHLMQAAAMQKHEQQTQSSNTLTISTIHRAKGLEWQHVYLPDFHNKIYPYSHRGESKSSITDKHQNSNIESERRLLYVAITRAISSLHLFLPEKVDHRKNQDTSTSASRFQKEMNIEACIDAGKALNKDSHPTRQKLSKHPLVSRYIDEINHTTQSV